MNSNNNALTCLPPPSTGDVSNSTGAGGSRTETPPVLRVLLLEDNVQLADLLRLLLEMWGFQPAVAHLGREASQLLEGQEFHLALVDIDLPDTTGFEVVADALAQGLLRNTRIIFFSGDPSDDRLAMSGRFPGSIFVPKPFEMRSLLALIQRLFATDLPPLSQRSPL